MNDLFANWQRMGLTSVIEFNGIKMEVNSPKAPKSVGAGAMEVVQGLPPYARRPVFRVDDYDKAPREWMRSTPEVLSVFVPVIADPAHHLWMDFNLNHEHTHDVAVVPVMQRINAIHGQMADGSGFGPELVQYRTMCPIHKTRLGANLRCERCGYDWPPQNYMAASAQKRWFWLDGFRTQAGVVRGFLLTHDGSRGVAAQKLGKRMSFALSFVFYLSREPKPVEYPVFRYDSTLLSKGGSDEVSLHSLEATLRPDRMMGVMPASAEPIHVGAGAKIEQKIERDPHEVSYWQDNPVATIIVNLIDAEACMEIVKDGPSVASSEGPLSGMKVGNPAELTKRLRELHPSDLDEIIVGIPGAGPYVSDGTPATKANELVKWAQRAGRVSDVEAALSRSAGGAQTHIHGNVHGPVFSGQFNGPVNIK
jgi:hypothetical protein